MCAALQRFPGCRVGRLRLTELQQKVCGEEEGMDESPRLRRAGAHTHPHLPPLINANTKYKHIHVTH